MGSCKVITSHIGYCDTRAMRQSNTASSPSPNNIRQSAENIGLSERRRREFMASCCSPVPTGTVTLSTSLTKRGQAVRLDGVVASVNLD